MDFLFQLQLIFRMEIFFRLIENDESFFFIELSKFLEGALSDELFIYFTILLQEIDLKVIFFLDVDE